MNRSFNKSQPLRFMDINAVEVKSKYGAEFRRFSVDRVKPGKFEEFYKLIVHIHHIANMEVLIGYADVHGDLLPINNDDNFCKAVTSAHPLLRLFIQKQEEVDYSSYGNTLTRKKKAVVPLRSSELNRKRPHIRIGMPHDFRPVSSIIDVDILPESHRRVRLYRHGSHKPLGFYIRDGTSVRVTPHGLEKVPGIFISRLVPGGLAEGTGLLAVNDEVLEVNGIEVTGKTLDQVTDMMIANSHNLIVTVKPVNQRNNVLRAGRAYAGSAHSSDGSGGCPSMPGGAAGAREEPDSEEDEEADLVIESSVARMSRRSDASLASTTSRPHGPAPPSPPSRPPSVVSTASFHSLPGLNGAERLGSKLHKDLKLHAAGPPPRVTTAPGERESMGGVSLSSGAGLTGGSSTASLHRILSSLRSDPRSSLALPQGGVEEDGTVITL